MTKRKIAATTLSLFILAGSALGAHLYNKKTKVRNSFEAACSNQVVAWLKTFGADSMVGSFSNFLDSAADGAIPKQITFGPNQQKMEQELREYTRQYVETGEDALAKIQIEWVNSYTPGYMKACTSFYMKEFKKCDTLEGEQRLPCAKKLDETFQEMIQASLLDETMIEKRPWDLASADLNRMMRAHRSLLAGQLAPDIVSAAFQEPKTAESRDENTWNKFIETTANLQKVISEAPDFLKNADPHRIQGLVSTVDAIIETLPKQFEAQKPQLINFRSAINLKRDDLVTQYCGYFQKLKANPRKSAITTEQAADSQSDSKRTPALAARSDTRIVVDPNELYAVYTSARSGDVGAMLQICEFINNPKVYNLGKMEGSFSSMNESCKPFIK